MANETHPQQQGVPAKEQKSDSSRARPATAKGAVFDDWASI